VDADGHRLAGRLLLDDALYVYDIFQTVDGCDLALATLVGASNDGDFVVLSDRDGADIVFLSEFLAQGCAHDCSSHTGWSIIMSFARLSP